MEPAFAQFQAMPIPYVEPVDISNLVLFLASDEGRYITGQQNRVDAGSLLKWPNGPGDHSGVANEGRGRVCRGSIPSLWIRRPRPGRNATSAVPDGPMRARARARRPVGGNPLTKPALSERICTVSRGTGWAHFGHTQGPWRSILLNHNRCHFAAQCRFGSETSTPKRVRFPAAPPRESGQEAHNLWPVFLLLVPKQCLCGARVAQVQLRPTFSRTRSVRKRRVDTGRNARAAAVSASRDSALSSMSAAATLNSSCSTLDAPGIATTPGRLISQASATCAGLAPTSVGDVAQRLQQRLDPPQVLGAEQRIHRPHAAGPVVEAVLAAEQSLRQRAVGDHDAVLALGERHEIVEGAGVGEREMHLVADHRPPERRIGLLPPRQRVVRDAGRADVAAVEQARACPA